MGGKAAVPEDSIFSDYVHPLLEGVEPDIACDCSNNSCRKFWSRSAVYWTPQCIEMSSYYCCGINSRHHQGRYERGLVREDKFRAKQVPANCFSWRNLFFVQPLVILSFFFTLYNFCVYAQDSVWIVERRNGYTYYLLVFYIIYFMIYFSDKFSN